MNSFLESFIITAREAPRLYFAPLIGAYKGIKAEYKAIFAEQEKARKPRKSKKA